MLDPLILLFTILIRGFWTIPLWGGATGPHVNTSFIESVFFCHQIVSNGVEAYLSSLNGKRALQCVVSDGDGEEMPVVCKGVLAFWNYGILRSGVFMCPGSLILETVATVGKSG